MKKYTKSLFSSDFLYQSIKVVQTLSDLPTPIGDEIFLENLIYFIDGDLKISESYAIMEYICAKWNPDLVGKDLEARGLVNMLAGIIGPLRFSFGMPCYGGDR